MFSGKCVISASVMSHEFRPMELPMVKPDETVKKKVCFDPGIHVWSLEGKLATIPMMKTKICELTGINGTYKIVTIDETSFCIAGKKGFIVKISLNSQMKIQNATVIRKATNSRLETIHGLDYDPKTQTLFSGSQDVEFWKISKENAAYPYRKYHVTMSQALKFLHGTTLVASSIGLSTIALFDIERTNISANPRNVVKSYVTLGRGDILGLDYDERNSLLISCHGHGSLSFHDVRTGNGEKEIRCDDRLRSVKLFGNRVLSADEKVDHVRTQKSDKTEFMSHIYVHDIRTDKLLKKFRAHDDYVYDILDAENGHVWTCCGDGSMKIWEMDHNFEEFDPDHVMKCDNPVRSACLVNLGELRKWNVHLEDLSNRVNFLNSDDNLFSTDLFLKVKIGKLLVMTILKSFFFVT